jgi:hypothetical protein
MNILTPKIRALQKGPTVQSSDFIENGSNGYSLNFNNLWKL